MKMSRYGLPLYEVGDDKPPASGVGGPALSGGGFGGSGGARMDGGASSEMSFTDGGGITLTPGSGVKSLGAGAEGQAKAADALKPGIRSYGDSMPIGPGGTKGGDAWAQGQSATGLPVKPSGGGINLTPGTGVTSLGAGSAGQAAAKDALGLGGPRSNSGLPLAPGPGQGPTPITLDKLELIRELAEMDRDGAVRRVRSIVRKGGPLGRLARELIR